MQAAECKQRRGAADKSARRRVARTMAVYGALRALIATILLFVSPRQEVGESQRTGPLISFAEAISVQRLNVPDLVVIDQQNLHNQLASSGHQHRAPASSTVPGANQPEAASLITNSQTDLSNQHNTELNQPQVTFECLVSYDRKKDRNLIIKWHHDDRTEPIYQWIPELNKRSIASHFRAHIEPIISSNQVMATQASLPPPDSVYNTSGIGQASGSGPASNQIQLLQAGFRLIRPTKDLGAPPRSFRFNASRTDIGAQLAGQRDRVIQLGQQLPPSSFASNGQQLPLAYRMKGFDGPQIISSPTDSPLRQQQVHSPADYVNVNQQRPRQSSQLTASASATTSSSWHVSPPTQPPFQSGAAPQQTDPARRQTPSPTRLLSQLPAPANRLLQSGYHPHNGVKLVCDIDQVFPVPEVSIYRLAKLDGSHPDKLAKLDTKIERDSLTGLYHVQVTSTLDDDELQMKYGLNEPVYFECLIALTNLELSKYADNKRSIVYRPGLLTSNHLTSEDIGSDLTNARSAARSALLDMRPRLDAGLMLALTSCLVCLMQVTWRRSL